VKLGRLLLAANQDRAATIGCIWKILESFNQIGGLPYQARNKMVKVGENSWQVGIGDNAAATFDLNLHALMKPKTKLTTLWPIILQRFNRELCAIESAQAKSTTRKRKTTR
jgi:hypothetical protein